LLGTVAQQQNQQGQQRRFENLVPPVASSTPAKQPTTSSSLLSAPFLAANGFGGGGNILMNGRNQHQQSSPMNQTILSNLSATMEGSQIREDGGTNRSSPTNVVQKQNGAEEKTNIGALMMENGDEQHSGGDLAGSSGGNKGDIIDSFGKSLIFY
jgi:hypothetical protein